MASPALTPGSIVRHPNRATQQTEQWGARSADGVFDFERLEDNGTTWRVTHLPSVTPDRPQGRWVLATSLPKARAGTAPGGWVWAEIAAQIANETRPVCAHVGQWTRTACPEPAAPGTTVCTRHGGTS